MSNSDSPSEDEDVPRPEPAELRCYFDGRAALEGSFANDIVGNLALASRTLGVPLISREGWVRIGEAPKKIRSQAERLVKELCERYDRTGEPLLQRDFEQVLNAVAGEHADELKDYFSERIKVSPRKREVMPRTPTQLAYVRAMRRNEVILGIGPAGTGKTYLAMAMAVSALLAGDVTRIILTRPAVEAGENLGFLPGKLEEKINPYLRPLYDALYEMLDFQEAEALIERNMIEVAPLAFMRGRTLNSAFVILDEAQNATPEQMLMFLTRLGSRSRCVVCGDPTQTDLPGRRASGLTDAARRLHSIPGIAVCRFHASDVVRHHLVEQIIGAYAKKTDSPDGGSSGENEHE